MSTLPSGHVAVSIVDFGPGGWQLPIEAKVKGLVEDDFRLRSEAASNSILMSQAISSLCTFVAVSSHESARPAGPNEPDSRPADERAGGGPRGGEKPESPSCLASSCQQDPRHLSGVSTLKSTQGREPCLKMDLSLVGGRLTICRSRRCHSCQPVEGLPTNKNRWRFRFSLEFACRPGRVRIHLGSQSLCVHTRSSRLWAVATNIRKRSGAAIAWQDGRSKPQ